MILATTITLSEPTLIARGQGDTEAGHAVTIKVETGVTDVALGGSATNCTFPLLDTDSPITFNLPLGVELWADGTGDIHLLETGLYKTPDL